MLLVKEYAEYKVENPNPPPSEDKKDERRTDDILPWDKDFMGKLEQPQLFDLIMVRQKFEEQDRPLPP
jgi:S-phase kinase-associated protein 1